MEGIVTWPSPPFPFPPPANGAAVAAATFVSLASLGLLELHGHHLAYSKFLHVLAGPGGRGTLRGAAGALVPSRAGMLVAYVPALVIALSAFAVPGAVDGARAQLLAAALAVHFLKRVLEVLLVHRYSGSMTLGTTLMISATYAFISGTMLYVQHLSRGLREPTVDLLYPGVLVFAVGIAGNFYHHLLLARLRAGDRGYKIPRGGLFELVVCPHYLFEIVGFFGFAMIAQTVFALAVAFGSAAYLAGRSCVTRRWYLSKFDEFPAKVKALVPYVF